MSEQTIDLTAPRRETGIGLKITLTLLFSFFMLSFLYIIYALWPSEPLNARPQIHLLCFDNAVTITQEQQFMLLMIFGGALGATLHVIISFTAFIGNKSFVRSWIPWYLLRPLVGAGIALIFYLLLRGGLLTYSPATTQGSGSAANPARDTTVTPRATAPPADTGATVALPATDTPAVRGDVPAADTRPQPDTPVVPLNPFGMMAIACLAGLFSKLAAKKMEDVFCTIFNAGAGSRIPYKDKLPTDSRAQASVPAQADTPPGTDPAVQTAAGREQADIDDVLPDADNEVNDNTPQG